MKLFVRAMVCLVCIVNAHAGEEGRATDRGLIRRGIRMFCLLQEFHPEYIAVSHVFLLDDRSPLDAATDEGAGWMDDTSANPSLPYHVWFPKLYECADLSGIELSPNILRYASSWDTTHWRGEALYSLYVGWIPKPLGVDSCYWMQGVVRRLPHLHTRDVISSGREFDWGNNAGWGSGVETDCRLLAFPKGTRIVELFGHMPSLRLTYDDWLLLFYNLEQTRKVSFHVKFILPKRDVPGIAVEPLITHVRREIANARADTTREAK